RHRGWVSEWSSDVCSSGLGQAGAPDGSKAAPEGEEAAPSQKAAPDERAAAAAMAASAGRGYLDGRMLAGVAARLRPDDLIWNYYIGRASRRGRVQSGAGGV